MKTINEYKDMYIDKVIEILRLKYYMQRSEAEIAVKDFNLSNKIDACPFIAYYDNPDTTAAYIVCMIKMNLN